MNVDLLTVVFFVINMAWFLVNAAITLFVINFYHEFQAGISCEKREKKIQQELARNLNVAREHT